MHARVKRATQLLDAPGGTCAGFNPRPREAGDAGWIEGRHLECGFNPRPREAGDRPSRQRYRRAEKVSIHARVKRATGRDDQEREKQSGFNPRPREAGDVGSPLCETFHCAFQSTPA